MMGGPITCPKCNGRGGDISNGYLTCKKKDDGFDYFICKRCNFELLDPKSVAKPRSTKNLFDGGWFIIGEGFGYEGIERSDLELTMNLNPICVNLERDMVMKGLSVEKAEELIQGLEIAIRFLEEGK